MRTSKRVVPLLVVCLCFCGFSLSCGSGRPPIPVGPLIISPAALPAALINVPYSATLTSVGGMGPFTWALASGTLPPGLTISTAGVISGTPTALGTTTFKVQVTDSQTPTKAVDTATKSISVNPPLSITTTSLAAGSINVPYSASLVSAGGVSPYTWTITSGSLPAGLSLAASGSITGTPTAQGTSTFTVQVSDSGSPAATASANLSITINPPVSRLNGKYIFSFSGYQNGNPVFQAGSFAADGQGNITNGLMDSNSSTSVQTSLSFAGTYSIDSTNTGPMTLAIPALGTFTYQIAAPAVGLIRFIQNGTAGNQGGVIRLVSTASPITIGSLTNFWSFGANGADAALNRYASVGTFQSADTGAWSNGMEDTNDSGTVAASQPFTGAFTGIDPVTGRGTATLTDVNSVTTHYSFYPISANELIMLGIDSLSSTAPLSLFSLAVRPLNNYTVAALNGPTVAALQGESAVNSATAPFGLLGVVTFDGAGNITASTDENTGGTLAANKYTGTYTIASNGRTALTGFGGHSVVFYLSANIAFTLEGDAAVTSGTLVPQVASMPTNASISGSYQGATLQAVSPGITVEADSATADGAGNLSLFFDISGPGGPAQGLTQALTYSVDGTGRAPLMLGTNTVAIAYVVTSASSSVNVGKFLVLSTDANAKINDLEK